MFTPGRCAASVPDVPCEPKPRNIKVLGTPFYRAPEVSIVVVLIVYAMINICI